ncbi:hypothetical protein [Burkholderia pseudomallei]|uniref:hypothetical protein n=1 Tax=Burkholderia pseudomallei TaxID=28450 RepID=UPI000F0757F4|nr:hypothetical protein [Burkholderia pseudomallei]
MLPCCPIHMLSRICNRSLPCAGRAAPRRGAGCNCNLQQMGVARDSGFRYIRLIRRGCRRCRYGERRRPPSGEPK